MSRSRVILLMVALLAGLGSVALTFQAAKEQRNSVAVSPPDGLVAVENPLNLGDVPQEVLDGTFQLVNQAKKPVRVLQIVQSCRCTEVEIPNRDIAPGETISVSFKWDSSGVRGMKGSSFTVFYSEEGRSGLRSLALSVKGNILPKFDFVPEQLEFTAGKNETKRICLVPRLDNSGIRLEQISCAFPAFRTKKISDQDADITFLSEEWTDDPYVMPYLLLTTNVTAEPNVSVSVIVHSN